jgi:MYXO-CTERM domain-containing protein
VKLTHSILTLTGVVALAMSASAQDFSNSGSFLGAINSNYYHETFAGWAYGNPIGDAGTGGTPQVSYAGPGANGFDWTAIGGTGVPNAGQNLWSLPGALSTEVNDVSITFNFSNSTNAVSAFGGTFQDTDQSGVNQNGSVVLTFMNGSTTLHTMTLTNDSASSFYGYVSSTPFTSVVVTIPTTAEFISAGSLYTGAMTAAPEPASFAVLGLAGLALIRRRRNAR